MAKEQKMVIKVRGHTVRSLSWEWAGRRNHTVEAWTANNKHISTVSLSSTDVSGFLNVQDLRALCDFLAVCFSEGDVSCACARVLACSCMLRLLHAEWILLAAFVISVFTVHSTTKEQICRSESCRPKIDLSTSQVSSSEDKWGLFVTMLPFYKWLWRSCAWCQMEITEGPFIRTCFEQPPIPHEELWALGFKSSSGCKTDLVANFHRA